MTYIEQALVDLAAALPEKSRMLQSWTKREVCLTLLSDGKWHVAAGGHPAVALGEWGGDFDAHGKTAGEAIIACLQKIIDARPSRPPE